LLKAPWRLKLLEGGLQPGASVHIFKEDGKDELSFELMAEQQSELVNV